MVKVVLLGGGNLGSHLANILSKTEGILLSQIYNRNIHTISKWEEKTAITDDISSIISADIYIICVADKAIEEISKKLPSSDALVLHTSGGIELDSLKKHLKRGVLYPLQTFTKDKKIDFKQIPFCIEANTNESEKLLFNFVEKISNLVYKIDSNQRKKLHVAAVFVNNFSNYLYQIGEDICKKNDIPFEILQPLILETATKTQILSPTKAQTGPAIRGDLKTIEVHQKSLTAHQKEIYNLLTKSILKNKA